MNHQLVNEDYLSSLIVLSKEQYDESFVDQLFQNLRTEYALFVKDCQPWIQDAAQKKEFQQRIHRLKNNFFNLGCEETGAALEEMYQALKAESPDPKMMQNLWERFESASEQTFLALETTLRKH